MSVLPRPIWRQMGPAGAPWRGWRPPMADVGFFGGPQNRPPSTPAGARGCERGWQAVVVQMVFLSKEQRADLQSLCV